VALVSVGASSCMCGPRGVIVICLQILWMDTCGLYGSWCAVGLIHRQLNWQVPSV